MKQEYKNIDDLLKGSLEGYVKPPPPGNWNKISMMLFLRSRGFYLSLLIAVVASTLTLILLQPQYDSDTDTPSSMTVQENNGVQAATVHDGLAEAGKEMSISDDRPNVVSPEDPSEQVHTESGPRSSSSINSDEEIHPETVILAQATTTQPVYLSHPYPELEKMTNEFTLTLENKATLMTFRPLRYPETILPRSLFPIPDPSLDYGFRKTSSLMLQVSPEWIFDGNTKKKISGAINIDLSYLLEGKDAFIQLGAGYGISKNDGIFNVNYSQYDSLGFYEQVNSFSVDAATGLPIYHTTTEGVFDTVNYSTLETSGNRYSYFRIPVTAGLKFYELKRLSFFAEAGATYSVLVKEHEPGITFTNEQATSVEIIDNSPARVKSTFQLSAGLGLKYVLNHRFDLRLDAMYNYYWNSIMERQNQQKSPFSISIKAGVQFKLKHTQ